MSNDLLLEVQSSSISVISMSHDSWYIETQHQSDPALCWKWVSGADSGDSAVQA
jgi:hypothetical protein